MKAIYPLILAFSLIFGKVAHSSSHLKISDLRCDYSLNPLGIDNQAPKLSWIINSLERNQKQTAYQILVSGSLELLNNNIGDIWDTGKVKSEQSVQISFKGKELEPEKKYYWKVCVWDRYDKKSKWSTPANWEMGLLDPGLWKAQWIGYDCGDSAPLLRKEFEITKPVKEVRAYISGLGYYELSINGSRVGDHVLDPAQTDYEQRTFYVVYDVTKMLKQGTNAIGVMLGNGWYNQNVVNVYKFGWGDVVYGRPKLILQIHITYADGTENLITTNNTWKGSTGPVISNNIYRGESYDARLEKTGWDKAYYNDSDWKKVELMESPGGKLEAQNIQAIKKNKIIKPIKITNPKPGVYVYDMGQNFAGWARLKLKGKKGTTIQLRFAETVFDDGMIDPASTGVYATGVVQTDSYTCKGEGEEIWEPRFTYHGFQYVEMTGFSGIPSLDNIEGVVVNTALEEKGTFKCSDAMINKIHRTILWTTLSNVHGIVTDCPHRERCQWLGDILTEMMVYNFDAPLTLKKFVQDIETGRKGDIPNHIAPGKRTSGKASSDWGSTFIQIPYFIYLYYGDISVAQEHYQGMTFFMDHLQKMAKNYILTDGWGDLFEPGSVRSVRTPRELTSTAFFYYDAELMSQLAAALGKDDDKQKYTHLKNEIKAAFIQHFYNKEMKTFGSQTGDAVALKFGLIPEGDETAVAQSMKKDIIENHNGHHSTGHMGTRYIYGELGLYGYGDVALEMLNQITYPSFGELFSRGATTVWEYWGERLIDETSAGTRSRNHPFQGGFDAWFYNGIAGINPDPEDPGFRHIIFRPQLTNSLDHAEASYNSIYGLISSKWQNTDHEFRWLVTVPANTTATIYIPASNQEAIFEGKQQVKSSNDILFAGQQKDFILYQLGSGRYSFTVKK